MLLKVEGIIIRSTDYGESNKILTIYTKEQGKIGVMARGAKKPKSRLSSISQLFIQGIFMVQKGSGLGTLSQGEVLNYYRPIQQDIIKTAYASYIVELVDKTLQEDKHSKSVYVMLEKALLSISEGLDPEVIMFIVELKMLRFSGVNPYLDGCVNCGTKEGTFSFSIREGGFLCSKCKQIDPYHIPITPQTAKILRLLYYLDIRRLGKINVKPETKKQIKGILSEYIEEYTGTKLKSKRFIDQLDKFNLE